MASIVPGFHFVPSDEILISSYLLPKSKGISFPPVAELVEKDLYGEEANPWEVLSDVYWDTFDSQDEKNGAKNVKKVIYVFTKVTKIKTRVVRRAGCGKWDGQTAPKEIKNDDGEVIGLYKMLSFQAKGSKRNESWIMHEYSLAGVSLKHELKEKDLVLCRITRNEKIKSGEYYQESRCSEVSNVGMKRSMVEEEMEPENNPCNKKAKSSSLEELNSSTPQEVEAGNGMSSLEEMNSSTPQEVEAGNGMSTEEIFMDDMIREAFDEVITPVSSPAHNFPDQVVQEEEAGIVLDADQFELCFNLDELLGVLAADDDDGDIGFCLPSWAAESANCVDGI